MTLLDDQASPWLVPYDEVELNIGPLEPMWPLKQDETVILILCTRPLSETPLILAGTRVASGWCPVHQTIEFNLGISNIDATSYNADFF